MFLADTVFFIFIVFVLLIIYHKVGNMFPGDKKIIELNGDSILYGLGLNSRLSEIISNLYPDWELIDKTASGLTIRKLIDGYQEPYLNAPKELYPCGPQLPFNKIQRNANIVVLELGGNDAYEKRSVDEFKQLFLEAIHILKNENKIIVVTGIVQVKALPPFDEEVVQLCSEYNKVIREIATEYNLLHAEWDQEHFDPTTDSIDGIHRNQEETNRLVYRLVQIIDKI